MAGGRRTFASFHDMARRRPWPGGVSSGVVLDLPSPSNTGGDGYRWWRTELQSEREAESGSGTGGNGGISQDPPNLIILCLLTGFIVQSRLF